jgi:hypothetical protein
MKSSVFWDMLCSSQSQVMFLRNIHLHLRGQKISQVRNEHEAGSICSSEMLVDFHHTTWSYILENGTLCNLCCSSCSVTSHLLKSVICWLLCDRSGEEGHFPQLTQCAETRLRQVAPERRVLRSEEPPLPKSTLAPECWDGVSNEIEVGVCTLCFCVCEQVGSETVAACL